MMYLCLGFFCPFFGTCLYAIIGLFIDNRHVFPAKSFYNFCHGHSLVVITWNGSWEILKSLFVRQLWTCTEERYLKKSFSNFKFENHINKSLRWNRQNGNDAQKFSKIAIFLYIVIHFVHEPEESWINVVNWQLEWKLHLRLLQRHRI